MYVFCMPKSKETAKKKSFSLKIRRLAGTQSLAEGIFSVTWLIEEEEFPSTDPAEASMELDFFSSSL
jgi:hypothetical protein